MAAAVTMFLIQQLELARRCRSHNCLQQPNVSETTKRIPRHTWRSPHVSISGVKTCSFKSQYDRIDNGVRFPLFSTLFLGVSLDLLVTSNSVLKIILEKCKIWWALRWVKASLMQNTQYSHSKFWCAVLKNQFGQSSEGNLVWKLTKMY